MTMIEAPRHNGATRPATALSDAEKRRAARDDWHLDNSLDGKTLAARYEMSPRWGQKQRAAAEAEAAGGTVPGVVAAQLGVPRQDTPPVAPVPRSDRKRTAPARARHVETTPLLLRAGELVGFVVVAVVCAVLSYNHVRDLAVLVGLDNPSWVPLGIDGLMVVTTCSLMIDKRAGRRSPTVARVGLVLGITGTLAANALAVEPALDAWSVVRMVLAVYPPVTLAVVLHLVFFRRAGDR